MFSQKYNKYKLSKLGRVQQCKKQTNMLTSSFAANLVYPTDLAVRQKAQRIKLKERWESESKSKEEIKALLKRKAHEQEPVFDDCRSDTSPIAGNEAEILLLSSRDIHEYVFPDSVFDDNDEDKLFTRYLESQIDADELRLRVEDEMNLLGSESEESPAFYGKPVNSSLVPFEELHTFLAQKSCSLSKFDVIEIFGGMGGVTRMAIRTKLKTGGNVDLITGTDLTYPAEARTFFRFLDDWKPEVVVLGPPCTAFANYSRVNRIIHPALR